MKLGSNNLDSASAQVKEDKKMRKIVHFQKSPYTKTSCGIGPIGEFYSSTRHKDVTCKKCKKKIQ